MFSKRANPILKVDEVISQREAFISYLLNLKMEVVEQLNNNEFISKLIDKKLELSEFITGSTTADHFFVQFKINIDKRSYILFDLRIIDDETICMSLVCVDFNGIPFLKLNDMILELAKFAGIFAQRNRKQLSENFLSSFGTLCWDIRNNIDKDKIAWPRLDFSYPLSEFQPLSKLDWRYG
jgi:hypothetical protein